MDKRVDMLNEFYDKYDEDTRVSRSRHGQLEYLTTMQYIHKLTASKSSVIEIGAGTGRYSIELAKEGYDVTAVELAKSNVDKLRQNSNGI